MKSAEYLRAIREREALSRAVLKKIEIKGNLVTFYLITDLTYSKEDVSYAESVSARFVPEGAKAQVDLKKAIPSEEGIKAEILKLLKEKFPAAAAFVSPNEISVSVKSGGGSFSIALSKSEREFLSKEEILDSLSKELMQNFCGVFYGDFEIVEKEEGKIESGALPPEEPLLSFRTFPIANYSPIDGASPKKAIYLADLKEEAENICISGRIERIEERMTKKEKPFFRITLTDGTDRATVSYFSKKSTLEKVRSLKEGDCVCLSGRCELYQGSYSFLAKAIDYGAPPEDFIPEARPSKQVPASYVSVFPEKTEDLVQGSFFSGEGIPERFRKEKFVVFDLETTGLNYSPAGGVMDRIIEIGAVKIESGQIVEKFSSFISCPIKLSAEIIKLTGITDEMLVGAPELKDVLADFYKFSFGCSLVAHNIAFDGSFLRYYGEKEGYLFENRKIDTLSLSQKLLRLPNYKLNTIADEFQFTFHHHRAFDDAFVTAKIFLELLKRCEGDDF